MVQLNSILPGGGESDSTDRGLYESRMDPNLILSRKRFLHFLSFYFILIYQGKSRVHFWSGLASCPTLRIIYRDNSWLYILFYLWSNFFLSVSYHLIINLHYKFFCCCRNTTSQMFFSIIDAEYCNALLWTLYLRTCYMCRTVRTFCRWFFSHSDILMSYYRVIQKGFIGPFNHFDHSSLPFIVLLIYFSAHFVGHRRSEYNKLAR